jgi:hypothetical protein
MARSGDNPDRTAAAFLSSAEEVTGRGGGVTLHLEYDVIGSDAAACEECSRDLAQNLANVTGLEVDLRTEDSGTGRSFGISNWSHCGWEPSRGRSDPPSRERPESN